MKKTEQEVREFYLNPKGTWVKVANWLLDKPESHVHVIEKSYADQLAKELSAARKDQDIKFNLIMEHGQTIQALKQSLKDAVEALELKITKEYIEKVVQPQLNDAMLTPDYKISSYCHGQLSAYKHCWSVAKSASKSIKSKHPDIWGDE